MTEFKDSEGDVHDLDLTGAECDACFYDISPCECGGKIHNWFIDEDWDSILLGHYCSKCGEDYSIPD